MLYFFSYGDDSYKQSRQRIALEAKALDFNYINSYSRNDISKDFLRLTQPYINSPRGGGYWLWKPFFLKKTFQKMDFNDYCVYADAGCSINPKGKDRFNYYIDLISSNDSDILSFAMHTLAEENYTTEEIFNFFNVEKSSSIRKSGQIASTILILRKTDRTQMIVNEYFSIAVQNPKIFSDDFNSYGNCESFIDNRHDQSVFSVMLKIHGSTEIPNETYADSPSDWDYLRDVQGVPFLSTRIKG